jgi:hypothetical protein
VVVAGVVVPKILPMSLPKMYTTSPNSGSASRGCVNIVHKNKNHPAIEVDVVVVGGAVGVVVPKKRPKNRP